MNRVFIILCALSLVGCEPIGPMPGGELSGHLQPVPSDWTLAREVEIVQLETRPEQPYSLNIWGVDVGKDFYIASGKGGESSWVEHLNSNSDVRLRIEESIYELKAVRVHDAAELERISERYREKYDYEQDATSPAEAWVYRLESR